MSGGKWMLSLQLRVFHEGSRFLKRKDITREAIRAAVRSQTLASARLEGRDVPADFKLVPEVQRFLDSVLAARRS